MSPRHRVAECGCLVTRRGGEGESYCRGRRKKAFGEFLDAVQREPVLVTEKNGPGRRYAVDAGRRDASLQS
jgi:hypothetical protein